MLGFDRVELIGKKVLDLVPAECREEVRHHLDTGIEKPYQTKIMRKDGTILHVESQARIIERDGKKIRVSAIQDISGHERAEETLRQALASSKEAKNKTESIFAAIGEGVCIEDRDFRIVYQNQVHKDLIGDCTGEFCSKLITTGRRSARDARWRRPFSTGR